jgi:MFS family permease
LQKKYGLNQADAGKIISIIGFASTILSPFTGWLLDKVGKHAIVGKKLSFFLLIFLVSFGTLTIGIYFVLFNVHAIPDIYAIGGVVGIGISYALVSAAIWP